MATGEDKTVDSSSGIAFWIRIRSSVATSTPPHDDWEKRVPRATERQIAVADEDRPRAADEDREEREQDQKGAAKTG
jgi:hypothetical protein